MVGLVEAARKYNPVKGKFTTYAYYRVKGSILNYLRDKSNLIRMPKQNNPDRPYPYPKITPIPSFYNKDSDLKQEEFISIESGYSLFELMESIKQMVSKHENCVLKLRYQGYTNAEISGKLGFSIGAVNKIILSLKTKVRTLLNEDFYNG